jgi:hypothetical protein
MKLKLTFLTCLIFAFASLAVAQDYQPAGDAWITKWWMLSGQITNTEGFAISAETDWLDLGTGGKLTDASASTLKGMLMTRDIVVSLPDNGGDLTWEVHTINPEDGNNTSTTYGLVDETNIETYAIIHITSPSTRTTTINPAHDDYGHIWLNGVKVYDNDQWTGAATTVTTPTDVSMNKGGNVLLFRLGESGGSDYFNLHFEASDSDLKIIPTMDDKFFELIDSGAAVEPQGKIGTWGGVK